MIFNKHSENAIKKRKVKGNIDFTEGDITKQILAFYWPLLLTSMLQQLYNFVDTLIVGKGLGDHALAAVGNMGSLFFLIVGFSMGISTGFGIIIAQNFGAKDYEALKRNIAATIELAVLIAIMLTIVSINILPDALRFLRTDEVIIADSLKYGYIMFGGLICTIAYNVSSCILRSLGDSRTPLKAIIISSVLNLILDSLFIFAFNMGVEGAALATVFSQIVSALVCIKKLTGISYIKLKKNHFVNEAKVYVNLFKNGLPMAFMNSITAVGCMVIQYFVNSYGVDYTSAYSACSKYINLFMNPACTAGNAMSAFTSQNYGAGRYDRIKEGLKVCITIALISYAILGTIMFLFPTKLAGVLLEGEGPINLASQYFPIAGIMLITVDCLFVFRSGVQGMGRPLMPMFSGVMEMIMRTLVIALFMGRVGFAATAYAEACAWTVALVVNILAFYQVLMPKLRFKVQHLSAKI
ncbi:MAG: MATE family efflux transporter [Lachnospiraceae bacterium]|nr:MATE family efflux transporter [Lachnospiraceae bacterium]